MPPHVREMRLDETALIIDYFHSATPEHLEMLGVDPTRLPARDIWKSAFEANDARPLDQRKGVFLIWLMDGDAVGFSTCDKIVRGEHANMHLHITNPDERRKGIGVQCVRRSADLYFDLLQIRRLFCEPNAFNVGPNRTLQSAGFRYVKTHMTVPGPLNFHQAVNRWVLERSV